ncbi:MAG TPA: hypothetical protein VGG25_07415 [Streptosporangiaceae bacterium]|jgi:hypothetical protein
MFPRILASATALAVLPALAAAAPASRVDSSTSVTVATGAIANSSGQAIAGVAVRLYAWPSDKVLQSLKPGQDVPTKLLATTTTGSSGNYSLSVPESALKAAAIERGWANLEVDSVSGMSWSFPFQTDPGVAEHVSLTKKNPGICTTNVASPWQYLRQLHKSWGIVGQGYIARGKRTNGDTVGFTYSHGQSSTLGMGVSAQGYAVSYSRSGTDKEWSLRTQGFAREHGNSLFRTEFRIAIYRQLCVEDGGGHRHQKGKCPRKDPYGGNVVYCIWKVRSNGWAGGATTLHPKIPPHTPGYDCVKEEKGAPFGVNTGTAVTWSQGLAIKPATGIGFNGQAQTGYDTSGHMRFKFGSTGYLCGTDGDPGSASQMVARGSQS